MRTKIMAMESIAFQGPAFFDALTRAIEDCQAVTDHSYGPAFYREPAAQKIVRVIHEFTGLDAMYDPETPDAGPAMYIPVFNINHIFVAEEWRDNEHMAAYVHQYLDKLSSPYFKGTIDLKNAQVSGDFAKLPARLMMPREMLTAGTFFGIPFTPKEIAAIILHETGHAFTTIEYADRMVTSNQVLATVSLALRSGEPALVEKVYAKAAARMRMTSEQKKALEDNKTPEGAAVIVAGIAVDQSRSELGESVFDVTACEQLADQFAARCGAAKDLVSALEKISQRNGTMGQFLVEESSSLLGLAALGAYLGLIFTSVGVGVGVPAAIILLSVLITDKSTDVYGSFHSRISRIRGEIVQRLKDRQLEEAEKRELLDALKATDAVLACEVDKLGFYETLAYYVKGSYRSAHKYEQLQRQLERYATNGLFGQAAKLATL